MKELEALLKVAAVLVAITFIFKMAEKGLLSYLSYASNKINHHGKVIK